MEPVRAAEGEMRQQPQENQQRGLRPGENAGPPPPRQICPRCDSMKTKFCYYNNYSLSQPRYYCKTCKRYWTQGGTLRNIPIGGSCRKNKRDRTSSLGPGDSSGSFPPPPPPPPPPLAQAPQAQQQMFPVLQSLVNLQRDVLSANPATSAAESLRSKELSKLGLPPTRPYHTDAGIFPSLVAVQRMSPPQPFNQSFHIGSRFGGAYSPCHLGGLDVPVRPFSSQQNPPQEIQQQQSALHQTSNQNDGVESLFQDDQSMLPARRPPLASWPPSFVNDINPTPPSPLPPPTSFWSSTTTITATSNAIAPATSTAAATTTSGTALTPDQWTDLESLIPSP